MNFMNFDAHTREVFDNDANKFENFNKLLLDAAHGNFEEGITAKEANEKIVSMFKKVIGLDEKANKIEIRKAIRRNQKELFAIIEETVEDLLVSGWQDSEFYNEYCDIKNLALGDENLFTTTDNSVLSVSRIADGHWDIDRQRLGAGRSYSVETNTYGIGIYSEYERLITNAEDFTTFTVKLYEAVDRFVNECIYQAFVSAAEKLPGGATGAGQWVKTGALSDATRDTFMTLVEDVEMATGSSVVIMGTKAALSKLEGMQKIDWVSEDMKVQRNTLGRIGYFEGIKLVELRQGFKLNDTTNRLINDKQLFIMPMTDNKFIKVVNVGDSEVKQAADMTSNQDQTYEYKYVFRMGVGVQIGLLFGVWNIT